MLTTFRALLWSVAVLAPGVSMAQVFLEPERYPQVTAADAPWQILGLPVFHGGAYFYPAGATVFFDGNVMVRAGTYEGVPLYQDATMAAYTLIYVPVGGNLMRPYEAKREGELAGTVGSRAPSFPVGRDADPPGIVGPEPGSLSQGVSPAFLMPLAEAVPIEQHVIVGSVPPPGTPEGVWIMYDGARWYSAGIAIPYSAERFIQIGEHQGFPVYRAVKGNADTIHVRSAADGPLAPYRRQ